MMKKLTPYILIAVMLVQLFAPFTVGMGAKNNLKIEQSKVEAADCKIESVDVQPATEITASKPTELTVNISVNNECIGKTIKVMPEKNEGNFLLSIEKNLPYEITEKDISFSVKTGEYKCDKKTCETKVLVNVLDVGDGGRLDFERVKLADFQCTGLNGECDKNLEWGVTPLKGVKGTKGTDPTGQFSIIPSSTSNSIGVAGQAPPGITFQEGDKLRLELALDSNRTESIETKEFDINKELLQNGEITYSYEFKNLNSSTGYSFYIYATGYQPQSMFSIYTKDANDQVVVPLPTSQTNNKEAEIDDGFPACDIWHLGKTFGGCIGIGLYWILFKPTSLLFGLAGSILDFTIMYSISDSSYRSQFVIEGWGIVRDFCNMFFIFVLLYIAIGTILNLSSVKTKEMIINVVIIGLLINFSLFATQVIIDASNILTRIFYNQKTIVTGTQKDAEGNTLSQLGEFGEIKLSEAIVSKVDPQLLVMEAKRVSQNAPASGVNEGEQPKGISAGSFIIVVILASAINIVGMIAFFSSALVFIARVVMLWMAMILAPLAFFSYMVPELQGIKMVGWKKWWPDTLKMAFVAPVFAFFMYIIVGFMDKGLGIVDASLKKGSFGLSFLIAIIVPFVFIMVLLMKAKEIAVDMSGEIGKAAANIGSKAGGLVLGAGIGAGAMAMRATAGRLGSSIANSDRLKSAEARGVFGAKILRNIGSSAGKSSFDVRATEAGKAAGKGMGTDLGKAKEGGYTKARADKVAYRQKRAKELEVGEDSPQTQAVWKAEHALHGLKTDRARQDALLGLNNGVAFEQRQAAIDAATANLADAQAARNALPTTAAAGTPEAEQIRLADNDLNDAKAALISANVADSGLGGLERAIVAAEKAVGAAERDLKDATDTLKTMKDNDPNRADQEELVKRLRTNRDAQIKGGNTVDVNTGAVNGNVVTGRDQAKINLESRQATIRAQEKPIHIAEDNLKRAQNAKIEVNNQVRHDYAKTIQGGWSNSINAIITLGQHSVQGETEAANKILAGVEEAHKITEHH